MGEGMKGRSSASATGCSSSAVLFACSWYLRIATKEPKKLPLHVLAEVIPLLFSIWETQLAGPARSRKCPCLTCRHIVWWGRGTVFRSLFLSFPFFKCVLSPAPPTFSFFSRSETRSFVKEWQTQSVRVMHSPQKHGGGGGRKSQQQHYDQSENSFQFIVPRKDKMVRYNKSL